MASVPQPPSSWIVRRSTPAIASRLAKVCRSTCGVTSVSLIVGLTVVLLLCRGADAYDLRTHASITEQSFNVSQGVLRYLEETAIGPGDVFDTIRDRSSSDPAATRAVVTALANALKDLDGGVRRAAAGSLGAIGPEAVDAIPSLAATTMDPDPSVRNATIEALGRIGSPAAVPVLVQALKDPRTGSLAVRALGNMGPTARGAIPALREFQSQNGCGRTR
jgi:hypothetical protein